MPSGAGHDANSMAHEGVPIGMIFVPSVKGVSHQGDEYTKPEHVDIGADVPVSYTHLTLPTILRV